jgi:hypothetical protein
MDQTKEMTAAKFANLYVADRIADFNGSSYEWQQEFIRIYQEAMRLWRNVANT